MRCLYRSHFQDYKLNQAKIDDDGMMGSESGYDSCWGRMCTRDRNSAVTDVLRGLLVLIGLAITITVVFLLCYFLLNDIEHKEDDIVGELINDINGLNGNLEKLRGNELMASDADAYVTGLAIGGEDVMAGKNPPPGNGVDGRREEERWRNDIPEEAIRMEPKVTFGSILKELPDENSPKEIPAQLFPIEPRQQQDMFTNFGFENEFSDVAAPEIPMPPKGCVPLHLPLCSGSMPWSTTSFPNFVNNNNVGQLKESLKYFQSILVGSRCSARATEYACAVLEPACGSDEKPLPPCRKFCQDIVESCSEFFVDGNIHNAAFQCGRFPASQDPNVCVDINTASPATLPTQPLEENESKKELFDQEQIPEQKTDDMQLDKNTQTEDRLPVMVPEDNIDLNTDNNDTPKLTNDKVTDEEKTADMTNVENSDVADTGAEVEVVEGDSVDSEDEEVFICDHSNFLCHDGSDCLNADAVCDGTQHCLDNSDEGNCNKTADCGPDEFSCLTTKYCVPMAWLCDGSDDCKDNSDEKDCPRKKNDDYDDTHNEDNLVAQASDGVFRVIAENPDGGAFSPFKFPSFNEGVDVDGKGQLGQLIPGEDPKGVLERFSKFGGDDRRNFGTDGMIIDDAEVTGVTSNEQGASKASSVEVEISERKPDRLPMSNSNRRRIPVRPGLNRVTRPEVLEMSPSEEPIQEESKADDSNDSVTLVEDEDIPEKESPQSDTTIMRKRPDRMRLHNRRNHFVNRKRRIQNRNKEQPKEVEIEAANIEEELTEIKPNERRGNRRPPLGVRHINGRPKPASGFESFKTGTSTERQEAPEHRPVSIIRRRPSLHENRVDSSPETREELLKKSDETSQQPQEDLHAVAQPITIPERVVPENPIRRKSPVPFRSRLPIRRRPALHYEDQPSVDDSDILNDQADLTVISPDIPKDMIDQEHDQQNEYTSHHETNPVENEGSLQYEMAPQHISSAEQEDPTQYDTNPEESQESIQYDTAPSQYENDRLQYENTASFTNNYQNKYSEQPGSQGVASLGQDILPSKYNNEPVSAYVEPVQLDPSKPQYAASPYQYNSFNPSRQQAQSSQYEVARTRSETDDNQYSGVPFQYKEPAPQQADDQSHYSSAQENYHQPQNAYQNPPSRYEQSTFNDQQPSVSSRYEQSSFTDQQPSASNYYQNVPHVHHHQYVDVPRYSEQTYHHPSVAENVYEYANPDYRYREAYS